MGGSGVALRRGLGRHSTLSTCVRRFAMRTGARASAVSRPQPGLAPPLARSRLVSGFSFCEARPQHLIQVAMEAPSAPQRPRADCPFPLPLELVAHAVSQNYALYDQRDVSAIRAASKALCSVLDGLGPEELGSWLGANIWCGHVLNPCKKIESSISACRGHAKKGG